MKYIWQSLCRRELSTPSAWWFRRARVFEEFDSDTEENEYYENEDYEDGELDPVEHENLLEMEGDSDEKEAEDPDLPDLEDAPPDAPFNLEDLGNFPHLAEDLNSGFYVVNSV